MYNCRIKNLIRKLYIINKFESKINSFYKRESGAEGNFLVQPFSKRL